MARIDEAGLAQLVATFYARIRADTELGPIFNAAIHDWPDHIAKLTDFWTSVMLGSGRYKGNPVAAHRQHSERITPELFERWLGIWQRTTSDIMTADAAAALQTKAGRIAESLQLALFFRLEPLGK